MLHMYIYVYMATLAEVYSYLLRIGNPNPLDIIAREIV